MMHYKQTDFLMNAIQQIKNANVPIIKCVVDNISVSFSYTEIRV